MIQLRLQILYKWLTNSFFYSNKDVHNILLGFNNFNILFCCDYTNPPSYQLFSHESQLSSVIYLHSCKLHLYIPRNFVLKVPRMFVCLQLAIVAHH
jgi:hypothetical protein